MFLKNIGKKAATPKSTYTWVAGGCDMSVRNPDGTYGATWMELHINGTGTSAWGYWHAGCIPRGTVAAKINNN